MDNDALNVITAVINTGGTVLQIPIKIVGELSAELLRNIVSVLWYALKIGASTVTENAKQKSGVCSMKDLYKLKGYEHQYCRIPVENKKEFFDDLRNRGVLFTVLPDLNTEDKYIEIAFHATDTPKINAACIKFHIGETRDPQVPEGIIGMEDYINNASKDVMSDIQRQYKDELAKGKKVDAPGEYTLTISIKKLLAKEDKNNYYTYIPGTYDQKTRSYEKLLIIPKSDAKLVHDDKSIEYVLKLDNDYQIYDGKSYKEHGVLIATSTLSGKEISTSYDHKKEWDVSAKNKFDEFIRRSEEMSYLHKTFMDDNVMHITEKYFILMEDPESKNPDQNLLVIPKKDVSYNSGERTYHVTLKNKNYRTYSYKEFTEGDMVERYMGKHKAADYLDKITEFREQAKEKAKSVAKEKAASHVKGR